MKLLKYAPVLLLTLVLIFSGCAANNPTAAGVSNEAAPAPDASNQISVTTTDTAIDTAVDTPPADEVTAEVTYITAADAESAALTHAGVSADVALGLRSEFDRDDRIDNYDVDFCAGDTEYDYEINAVTGEVLKVETEKCDHRHSAETTPTENTVPADHSKAVAAALSHAGVSEADVLALRTDYDFDDGVYEYEVDFWYDGYEYEYDVNAETLEIIRFEKEPEEKPAEKTSVTSSDKKDKKDTSSSKITKSEAKAIALRHAGVSESSAKHLEVEYDKDDGVYKYEVSFEHDGYEYDYEINAETGKIISREKERDD